MCLAPPKAAPAAFLNEVGSLRQRGKATLAAAARAAAAVASAPSADDFDVAENDAAAAAAASKPAAPSSSSPSLFNDLLCLKTMWFQKASGDTHEERLSSFYAPQAEACEFSLIFFSFRRQIEGHHHRSRNLFFFAFRGPACLRI